MKAPLENKMLSGGQRAWCFALDLLARYRLQPAGGAGTVLVFHQPLPAAFSVQTPLTLRMALSLHLQQRLERRGQVVVLPEGRDPLTGRSEPGQAAALPQAEALTRAWLYRQAAAQQAGRVNRQEAAAPPSGRPASLAEGREPPSLAFTPKGAEKLPLRQDPPAASAAALPTRSTELKPETPPAAPPASMPDLNQLAEQVVRAIDQRVTAERERLGRL
jgi:hypothetical protein